MRYLLISQLFLLDSNEIEWIEALNELRIFLKIKKKNSQMSPLKLYYAHYAHYAQNTFNT